MFCELTEKEFEKFSIKYHLTSFQQTVKWGKLKQNNGWKYNCVGIKKDNKVICATLLLYKKIPLLNYYIFYSPRGFLIDFSNYSLLKNFTLEIKKYIKDKKGIFLKIDPYLINKERDKEGNIIKNGLDNKKSIDNLLKLGFKHYGFNLYYETLQPRWLYTITTKNKTYEELLKEMDYETRQIIKKNEESGIKVRIIEKEELNLFKDIMQHTGDRRGFIDRPLKYYEDMYDSLGEDIVFAITELNIKKLIEKNDLEINELKKELKRRKKLMTEKGINVNKKRNKNKIEEIKKLLNSLIKKKEVYLEYAKDKEKIVLAGTMFIVYGNEVIALFGGAYGQYSIFKSTYTPYWEFIKYAVDHKYSKFNFYGITGNFDVSNPLYGLYLFKKSFGGNVEELIGEFDLIIRKPLYLFYNVAIKLYFRLKKIKGND